MYFSLVDKFHDRFQLEKWNFDKIKITVRYICVIKFSALHVNKKEWNLSLTTYLQLLGNILHCLVFLWPDLWIHHQSFEVNSNLLIIFHVIHLFLHRNCSNEDFEDRCNLLYGRFLYRGNEVFIWKYDLMKEQTGFRDISD